MLSKVGMLLDGALQGSLVDKARSDTDIVGLAVASRFEPAARPSSPAASRAGGRERVIVHQLGEYGLRDTGTYNQGECNAILANTIARHEYSQPALHYS